MNEFQHTLTKYLRILLKHYSQMGEGARRKNLIEPDSGERERESEGGTPLKMKGDYSHTDQCVHEY